MKKTFWIWSICFISVFLFAATTIGNCFAAGKTESFMADTNKYYKKFGILPQNKVAPHEDGMRTNPGPGNFEWWYFDTKLNDGSSLVLVYYTKHPWLLDQSFQPYYLFTIVKPDGTTLIDKRIVVKPEDFKASKTGCDFSYGPTTVKGDLNHIKHHIEFENVVADVEFDSTMPSWRPDTGHFIFKQGKKENFFAWLPVMPQAKTKVNLKIAGEAKTLTGEGYHDRNWGDISVLEFLSQWIWGRAEVGKYTTIAFQVTGSEKWNNKPIPVLVLAKDGKIILNDKSKLTVTEFGKAENVDPQFPKAQLPAKVVYVYKDKSKHYRITFERLATIWKLPVDKDSCYFRFFGAATVEKLKGNKVVETSKNPATVWEFLWIDPSSQINK